MIKKGLLYAKSHEWLNVDGKTATVGISDHAQDNLGDVVFIELPQVGQTIKKGESFGAVESVKAASDMYLPISGKILEVNSALENTPELLNSDPYGSWIVKLEILDEKELDSLLKDSEYKEED
ncbi:glycine cleavage system protein GcvH [Mariniplasma anaerobium]|uniref:Glycine cleavage system H protein n=1 Tax=Mariniplasma anaerobium TaxID=2735436 RepID=A0A7U9TH11_9MOLU|nr:glycine cleavage system protein GcvH [Mariniplasma anaerobium]BCR35612.1 glycine cleavage system H protein [Mariniplasma anaerobium]